MRTMEGSIVHGRGLERGFEERCDVVVVGSGAGGAVVAKELAEAGYEIIVLEEGPHYTPDEIASFKPSESLRRMWREAGLLAAMGIGPTPVIGITVGRNVGGSSVHTGGVCFRIPSAIHREWERDLGLNSLSERACEDAYRAVEARVRVAEVPASARSIATNRFVEGAAKLGIPFKPMRRNAAECEGNGVCNFGCPKHAKLSVDLSYLPDAIAMGTRVFADALVTTIERRGDRVTGVSGELLAGAKKRRFTVHARAVVIACGTLHTPVLLGKNGVSSPHLGRHVTLHPSVRLAAQWPDDLRGWDGALQSVFSDHFASEGITLNGVYSAINVLASALPGLGPSHRRRVREMAGLGCFGGLVHDEGGGRVRLTPGREGLLTYEMSPRDLARLRRAITIMGEMALAGGAKEVLVPIFGAPPVRDRATLRRLETDPLDPRRMECIAFHPLGSARMANDERRGVTGPDGAVYGASGLFVADGSVLPSSIGVNSQLPIMTMATKIAWGLRERLERREVGARAAVR